MYGIAEQTLTEYSPNVEKIVNFNKLDKLKVEMRLQIAVPPFLFLKEFYYLYYIYYLSISVNFFIWYFLGISKIGVSGISSRYFWNFVYR